MLSELIYVNNIKLNKYSITDFFLQFIVRKGDATDYYESGLTVYSTKKVRGPNNQTWFSYTCTMCLQYYMSIHVVAT